MKLYNTLSRSTEEIQPINAPDVTVYTCGPTVYDYPHIGNWFTFIRYDVLVRALKIAGFEPRWVMNITDVGHLVSDADEGEDKLEKGARREGKTAWDVAQFYSENFEEGLRKLNILQPEALPKATGHIQEQIELIQSLEHKGFTYIIDDGVYFETTNFKDYGKLARLDIAQLQAGARVEFNPQKHSPTDFALWKFSPAGTPDKPAEKRDMEWDSPWGKGFPGWHIECSAMSMKYLGETLDIHAGGIDHIPVHHTNEIAQSEASTGKTFSNVWMHANHIFVDGQKISKSLGNGHSLEDIIAAGYDPLDIRLLALESHYRSQAEFSWDTLSAARTRRHDFIAFADLRFQATDNAKPVSDKYFEIQREAIKAALQDDLNTSVVLRVINETAGALEANGLHPDDSDEFAEFLQLVDDALGLQLAAGQDITENQRTIITEREAARASKNWARSDELRGILAKDHLGVRDTPYGSIWFRQRQV